MQLQKRTFESQLITIQRWKWKPNTFVIQIFIGRVEIRRWLFARKIDCESKYDALIAALEKNERITV